MDIDKDDSKQIDYDELVGYIRDAKNEKEKIDRQRSILIQGSAL